MTKTTLCYEAEECIANKAWWELFQIIRQSCNLDISLSHLDRCGPGVESLFSLLSRNCRDEILVM